MLLYHLIHPAAMLTTGPRGQSIAVQEAQTHAGPHTRDKNVELKYGDLRSETNTVKF